MPRSLPRIVSVYQGCCRLSLFLSSALFNFNALLLVILLLICTCAYVRQMMPGMMDSRKDQNIFYNVFWKFARIGERLSPHVSICCIVMAVG
ncbi:DUF1242-domain-containing protein [Ascodesmis nigricans]|uniref:Protein kish n=1 Tax=Ascodesmis nigricans TaxID=341454 RepID=A0A4S2N5E0_9PEZI|nr:DUF1242-domain-containing protein [Ascodesmis nigricans]